MRPHSCLPVRVGMKIMRGEQAGVPEASLAEDVLGNDTILSSILKQTVFTFQSGKGLSAHASQRLCDSTASEHRLLGDKGKTLKIKASEAAAWEAVGRCSACGGRG